MKSVSRSLVPIREVEIENFKSIKHLKFDCRRLNIFIGEPNTGKSNIIESVVGLPSVAYYGRFGVTNFIRFEDYSNIFYDNNLDDAVNVKFNGKWDFEIKIYFKDGSYYWSVEPNLIPPYTLFAGSANKFNEISKQFKFYRFSPWQEFKRRESEFLLPDGSNFPSVYATHKRLREIFGDILQRYGLRLMREPDTNKIKVVKETEFDLITYPYQTLSDTFRRLMFYISAILTNKNSIIAMEEPEANAFPFYTKYLAELVALDDSNQYFVTTHNPYFLLTLIEKTPKEDLAVYITYYEDYQTKVKKLSERKFQEILNLGSSVFFNLDALMED
ncbi:MULTISPECIES: AAA family ATPase [unclassified Archaeoglobus]|jgi:hypothetical protein|uniref:AAA family ATPase n=1 Tax=unclassified Archaeoglobus TaxID=2643606 RepID=UPI0025BA4373|nr:MULTISPECIES: AAA family ATPase [unclassified Archaeoglobus]